MSQAPLYSTTDLARTAVLLTLGARLDQVSDADRGLVGFTLSGVSGSFESDLVNDAIQVSARALLDNLERLHRVGRQRRQARGAQQEGGS